MHKKWQVFIFLYPILKLSLRRPYGTPNELVESHFPTLKRGANKQCAFGAFVRIILIQPSIASEEDSYFAASAAGLGAAFFPLAISGSFSALRASLPCRLSGSYSATFA